MSIRIEWDVPDAGESVPFGDLASFVARAGTLGAEADTPVLVPALSSRPWPEGVSDS
jgi:hypothetical protein